MSGPTREVTALDLSEEARNVGIKVTLLEVEQNDRLHLQDYRHVLLFCRLQMIRIRELIFISSLATFLLSSQRKSSMLLLIIREFCFVVDASLLC